MKRLGSCLFLAIALGLGCTGDRPAGPSVDYVAEIEAFRARRADRLRSENGWLSLIGLFWLEPGANPFGSDRSGRIVLPAGAAPPRAGSFFLEDGVVRLVPEPGIEILLDGEATGERILRDDAEGSPDVLQLGRLRLHVIERGGRHAVRVRDPESPARAAFGGLEFFAVDPAYRVEGRFRPHDEPERREIATVVGTTAEMFCPGVLEFELNGTRLSLEPYVDEPGRTDLFIIFKDRTSGEQTYGAGRFLSAELDGERAVLDFNKAYSPPCAFTPFATCPLPPARNRLDVAILAGEKVVASHETTGD